MIVRGNSLYMTRGDNESIKVKISGYELKSGDFIEFTVRKNVRTDRVLYKKVTEFQDNSFLVDIVPEDTESLNFGDYLYDMQLTYSGYVKTLITPNKFTIGEECTYG